MDTPHKCNRCKDPIHFGVDSCVNLEDNLYCTPCAATMRPRLFNQEFLDTLKDNPSMIPKEVPKLPGDDCYECKLFQAEIETIQGQFMKAMEKLSVHKVNIHNLTKADLEKKLLDISFGKEFDRDPRLKKRLRENAELFIVEDDMDRAKLETEVDDEEIKEFDRKRMKSQTCTKCKKPCEKLSTNYYGLCIPCASEKAKAEREAVRIANLPDMDDTQIGWHY